MTYLIALAEDKINPGVRLRGTASKARTALEVDQPRKLAFFGFLAFFFGRLNRFVKTTDTAGEEPQLISSGFAVVHRDIKEQLGDPKLA